MYAQDKHLKKHLVFDRIFRGATCFFALLVLLLFAAIIIALVLGSLPSIKQFGAQFILDAEWNPVTEKFGAFSSIVGTVLSAFIAISIAVPISFGIALFLTELSPSILRRPLGIAIELLAGIPSIIYGMWGLFIFAPYFADYIQPALLAFFTPLPFIGQLFQGPPMGIGLLTAGLVLSIMIIPFISSLMRDVFCIVPAMLKESAYGLGCTKWEVVWNIILPYTRNGVIGGIMLGLGRALGETMAVTFVMGNSHNALRSLFDPATSISATLANEFTEATGVLHLSALIELGLLLFIITFIVLALSKLLLRHLAKSEGNKT